MKWRITMPGWTRQVVRMATIRIIVLSLCHSLCAMASTGQLHLPMLHDVTIANGLKNSCDNCPVRGCVVHPDTSLLLPSFNEETAPSPLESAGAVFLALSYARCNLSDGIDYSNRGSSTPPDLSILVKSRPSYVVEGVNLTNLFARTFTFTVSPPFSTEGLRCTLVSFFRSQSYHPENHVFSLYVNDMTGAVGLSIQECSGFMRFLSNVQTRYPFLVPQECQTQAAFHARINQKKFSSYHSPFRLPLLGDETNRVNHAETEVAVDMGDL